MKLKYKVLISVWIVLIAICLFTYYSYAMWVINLEGQSENKIKVTCFNASFQEASTGNSINLYNTYPVSSERALRELSPYVFTISNECQDGNSVDYTVTLNKVNNDMGDAFVRVLILDEAVDFTLLSSDQIANYISESKIVSSLPDLTNDDNIRELLQFTPVKSYQLTTGTLNVEDNKTYYLYVWIDSTATQSDVGGKKYEASVDVLTYTTYHEPVTSATTLSELQALDNTLTVTTSTATNPDFSKAAPSDADGQTTGLFELEDDYGTSYYFRGAPINNYVKFAGFYWRIIRINGDGSIRMIYAGDASVIDGLANKAEVLANGYDDSSTQYTQIGTSPFNSSYNDNAYVGYMYGTVGSDNYNDTHTNTNNSTIKTYIDTWYENNLRNTAYESYIADSIFCNDRSVASADTISYANSNFNPSTPYTTNAFGTNWTIYGASGRQIEQFNQGLGNRARLTCPNKNDAFTVSDTMHGNGALDYPVGLITIDEANIAGGAEGYNVQTTSHYLRTGNWYRTGSPWAYRDGKAYVQSVDDGGTLGAEDVHGGSGVRPVINLKSGSLTTGSGTASNPYEVE